MYLNDLPLPEIPDETTTYKAYMITTGTDGKYLCKNKINGLIIGWDDENNICTLVTVDPSCIDFSVEKLLSMVFSKADIKELLEDASVTEIVNHVGKCVCILPLPPGVTCEYYEKENGILQKYSAYVNDTHIVEYDNYNLTVLDNEDENGGIWTTEYLASFLNKLPRLGRVCQIQAYKAEKLTLPYTCHTIDDNALQMPNCSELYLQRSNMQIGKGNLAGKKIFGIAGSTAESKANRFKLQFTPRFQKHPAPKEVRPWDGWEFFAPEESVYIPETPNTWASLELVNLPDGGQMSFSFRKFDYDGDDYKQAGHFIQLFHGKVIDIGILIQFAQNSFGLCVQRTDFTISENDSLLSLEFNHLGNDKAEFIQELRVIYDIISDSRHFGQTVRTDPFPEKEIQKILEDELEDSKSIDDVSEDLANDLTRQFLSALGIYYDEEQNQNNRNVNGTVTDRPENIIIADDWSITVPGGYIYSTESDIIGSHRCIIFMKNDETADFDNPFCCSESYICMDSQGQFVSGDLLEYSNKLKTEAIVEAFHSGENKKDDLVVKRTGDVTVFCQICHIPQDDDDQSFLFRVQIVTEKGIYPMQVFFNEPGTLEEFGNRLLYTLGSVGTANAPCEENYFQDFYTLHEEIPVVMPDDEEIYRAATAQQGNRAMMYNALRNGIHINDSVEYCLSAIEDISVLPFELPQKAWHMTDIFRMEENFFDPEFDREAEIRHGFIREIDHFSAFRSFAWCVAEYCHIHSATTQQLDLKTLLALAQIVDSREYINYDETHYPAICGVPDMETFYLPHGEDCSRARDLLDDNGEHWGIADLYLLREELTDLYPCIEKIYNRLRQNRNDRTKPLRGIHSDLVYVWCALTIAADHAFATTPDAPMNYFFDVETEEVFPNHDRAISFDEANYDDDYDGEYDNEYDVPKKETKHYVDEKRERYDNNCVIVESIPEFYGKTFVASGIGNDDEIRSFLEANGAFLRKSISGKTDYLIVSPESGGNSKYNAVLEQAEKGHTVKVIFYDDFIKYLSSNDENDVPEDSAEDYFDRNNPSGISNFEADIQKLGDMLSDAESSLEIWISLEEKRFEKEENEEKELKKKKLKAKLTHNAEEEKVFMYMTLIIEKANNSDLSDDDFYECYEEDFPALSKKKLSELRQDIGNEMLNDPECYEESVRALPYDKRFYYSAGNMFNTHCYSGDPDEDIESLIMETVSRWFEKSELSQLKEGVRNIIEEKRSKLDENLSSVNEDWKIFSSAKKFLCIGLVDDSSETYDPDNKLMIQLENVIGEVELATSGYFPITTRLMNYFPVYWQVTPEEIWNAAKENDIDDSRESKDDGRKESIAREVYKKAMQKLGVDVETLDYGSDPDESTDNDFYDTNDINSETDDDFDFSYTSGYCGAEKDGKNLKWSYDENSCLLKIYGRGTMEDYDSIDAIIPTGEAAPWHEFGIKKVIIENSVTSIGNRAFFDCSNLTSVTISDSVTSIGKFAFYGCSSLTSIIISDGVKNIGDSAFEDCSSLTSVTIPDSVTSIGYSAFEDCSSLTSVTIPDSVTSIGKFAFYGCNSLTSIIISDSVASTVKDALLKYRNLNLIIKKNIKDDVSNNEKEGCYIATAVYGSYDAPEVKVLRRFRDEILKKSFFGRLFIKIYYKLSPAIAKRLKNARKINDFVRNILDRWVNKLISE